MKTTQWGLGILGLVVIIGLVFVLGRTPKGNSSVRVTGNVPLSGDLAMYGEYIRNGVELANKDLGTKYPQDPKITFDWQDNQGEAKGAVSAMQRQYLTSPPDIYISGLKPQTAAITDRIKEKGTPHFTWILDVLINASSTNNIRTWINFKKESEVFIDYLKNKQINRVAILYGHTDAADEEYEELVEPALKAQGLTDSHILRESYSIDRSDFRDLPLKVKAFNLDIVIVNGFVPHIVAMVKQFRVLEIIKNGNTLASLDMLDASSLLPVPDLEGIVVAAPLYLTRSDTTVLTEWKTHFKKIYGREPTYHEAYAYDMVQVIHDASTRLQLPATSKDWITALRKTHITGVTGDMRFDDDGSLITTMEPAVYRSGKLVPL